MCRQKHHCVNDAAHVSAERSGSGAELAVNGTSGSGAVSGHSRKGLSGSRGWSGGGGAERERIGERTDGCHNNRFEC